MYKHGLMYVNGKRRPEYNVWHNMKKRCLNPEYQSFSNYGGRGIKVCDRWIESFENFFNDMGEKPSQGHSIDRVDNDGNYEPENCRWATRKEQARNRRSNVFVVQNGKAKVLSEICEANGIKSDTASKRISCGWSLDAASSTPVKKKEKNLNEDKIKKLVLSGMRTGEIAIKLNRKYLSVATKICLMRKKGILPPYKK
jgi:hypothetical protein